MRRGIQIALIVILILITGLLGLIIYLYPGIAPVIRETYIAVEDVLPSYENPAIPEQPQEEPVSHDTGPFTVPEGFGVQVYIDGFAVPRALIFDGAGHLLVSDRGTGTVWLVERAGDSVTKRALITGLTDPHGLAVKDGYLYVATRDAVYRYGYDVSVGGIVGAPEKLFDVPFIGGHFTRSLLFDADGNLLVTVGSSCNVCHEPDDRFAAVIRYTFGVWDGYSIFASGLRNSVFLTENPTTGEVWAADNGRDWLGDTLPPEEINILREGENYGWPICYGDKIHDTDFDKNQYIRNPCEDTQAPTYTLGAHQAPLGLSFINSAQFPSQWQGDLLVALHGSWNSSTPVGYKIVRLDVEGNKVVGDSDFMTGFISDKGVVGRPVDLTFGPDGSLYVTDDKAGVIYRIYK